MEESMIIKVHNKKLLKKFIYFPKLLYGDDNHYIYPLFSILKKELIDEVLKENKYTAIICLVNNEVKGRLLYTYEENPRLKEKVCYFSYFDAYDEQDVFNELFDYVKDDMKKNGIKIIEGTFTPYDPDNRRGVLVKGFEEDPVIFTSYNYPYYQRLFENYGFTKLHDTYSLKPPVSDENKRKLDLLSKFFERRYDVEIKPIDFKNMDREIKDIHEILEEATTEVIYQEAPSIEMIKSVANNLKFFLDNRIILIAREKKTSKPIGFVFCLLDYNQLFKLSKGKIPFIRIFRPLKYISKVRGMMQYVVPKYQSSGLIGVLYKKVFDSFEKMGITDFEAGTMMEENQKPLKAMAKFGGEINKVYRIYRKEIS